MVVSKQMDTLHAQYSLVLRLADKIMSLGTSLRFVPEVLPLLSETGAVWALNPDPCTDSSLDFQYTVEIVAVHLSLRSPCKKCLCRTFGNKKSAVRKKADWNAKSKLEKRTKKGRTGSIFKVSWKSWKRRKVIEHIFLIFAVKLLTFLSKNCKRGERNGQSIAHPLNLSWKPTEKLGKLEKLKCSRFI